VIQLVVDNSYSRVLGLTLPQFNHLRDELSYTSGSFFTRFGPTRKSMLNKRGEFPSGLLPRVIKYLSRFVYAKKDLRIRPAPSSKIYLSDMEAYESQRVALGIAVTYGQGTISMPTGSGKSRVIQMIAACYNLKTLVVVPSLEIKRQLSETLKDNKNVAIRNIDAPDLTLMADFDCLIIDEAHHVTAKTYQKLNKTAWKGIYYRFLLTATPFRNNDEEQLLFEGIAGQVIYRLSYIEAVKKKYIVPVEAYTIEVPKQKTDASTWAQVYSQLVVNNTLRNQQIVNVLTSLHSNHKSTLCLVKEVKHGKILSDLTGLPFCSGEDEDSRRYISRFNKGEISVLIATEGMMSEGIDTKPCEYAILVGLGKAKSALMQKIGRTVRTYPGKDSGKVILFSDFSHKFTKNHYKEQVKILKEEYGIVPSKLENI
jgi:superfamily II DNA or RNA helicase